MREDRRRGAMSSIDDLLSEAARVRLEILKVINRVTALRTQNQRLTTTWSRMSRMRAQASQNRILTLRERLDIIRQEVREGAQCRDNEGSGAVLNTLTRPPRYEITSLLHPKPQNFVLGSRTDDSYMRTLTMKLVLLALAHNSYVKKSTLEAAASCASLRRRNHVHICFYAIRFAALTSCFIELNSSARVRQFAGHRRIHPAIQRLRTYCEQLALAYLNQRRACKHWSFTVIRRAIKTLWIHRSIYLLKRLRQQWAATESTHSLLSRSLCAWLLASLRHRSLTLCLLENVNSKQFADQYVAIVESVNNPSEAVATTSREQKKLQATPFQIVLSSKTLKERSERFHAPTFLPLEVSELILQALVATKAQVEAALRVQRIRRLGQYKALDIDVNLSRNTSTIPETTIRAKLRVNRNFSVGVSEALVRELQCISLMLRGTSHRSTNSDTGISSSKAILQFPGQGRLRRDILSTLRRMRWRSNDGKIYSNSRQLQEERLIDEDTEKAAMHGLIAQELHEVGEQMNHMWGKCRQVFDRLRVTVKVAIAYRKLKRKQKISLLRRYINGWLEALKKRTQMLHLCDSVAQRRRQLRTINLLRLRAITRFVAPCETVKDEVRRSLLKRRWLAWLKALRGSNLERAFVVTQNTACSNMLQKAWSAWMKYTLIARKERQLAELSRKSTLKRIFTVISIKAQNRTLLRKVFNRSNYMRRVLPFSRSNSLLDSVIISTPIMREAKEKFITWILWTLERRREWLIAERSRQALIQRHRELLKQVFFAWQLYSLRLKAGLVTLQQQWREREELLIGERLKSFANYLIVVRLKSQTVAKSKNRYNLLKFWKQWRLAVMPPLGVLTTRILSDGWKQWRELYLYRRAWRKLGLPPIKGFGCLVVRRSKSRLLHEYFKRWSKICLRRWNINEGVLLLLRLWDRYCLRVAFVGWPGLRQIREAETMKFMVEKRIQSSRLEMIERLRDLKHSAVMKFQTNIVGDNLTSSSAKYTPGRISVLMKIQVMADGMDRYGYWVRLLRRMIRCWHEVAIIIKDVKKRGNCVSRIRCEKLVARAMLIWLLRAKCTRRRVIVWTQSHNQHQQVTKLLSTMSLPRRQLHALLVGEVENLDPFTDSIATLNNVQTHELNICLLTI